MKLWDKIGKTGQRIILISTVAGILSATGMKVARWAEKYASVPRIVAEYNRKIDSLKKEVDLAWKVAEDIHYEQIRISQSYEMLWHLAMAETKRYEGDFFISTLKGHLGVPITVYIREDDLRPPEHWAFYKVCTERGCDYYLFQAKWSGVHNKFYIVDHDGEEHLIFQQ